MKKSMRLAVFLLCVSAPVACGVVGPPQEGVSADALSVRADGSIDLALQVAPSWTGAPPSPLMFQGLQTVGFNDLAAGQVVDRDHYLASAGVQVDIGPNSAMSGYVRAAGGMGPCNPTRSIQTEPFTGPSKLFRFPAGTTSVTLSAGDFGADQDTISLIAYGDDALAQVVDSTTVVLGSTYTGCMAMTVEAMVIKVVEVTSTGAHPNSFLVDDLIFEAAAPATNCDSNTPICDRFAACLGPAWAAQGTSWQFDGVAGCTAKDGNDASPSQAAVDELIKTVALRPDDWENERFLACAVLEQSLGLCRNASFTPASPEPQIPRTASCHPGASQDCSRHRPVFQDIVANATMPPGFTFDGQTDTLPDSYCSGQVMGALGYAETRPQKQNVPNWQCEPADVARLRDAVKDMKAKLMGWPYWPRTWDLEAESDVDRNQCRVVKALVDCVVPNMGEGTKCAPGGGTGMAFDAFGDYCFRVVQTTDGEVDSAHRAGRAIDFNNNIFDQANDGNIEGCVGRDDKTGCTNYFHTARIDLPPEFVSIMETCGFLWLGRPVNQDNDPIQAEGGHLGCDPMHFELP